MEDPARASRLLAIITQDVQRLDRLITDISDSSRLDAELSRSRYEIVDMARMLATLAEIHDATRKEGSPLMEVDAPVEGLYVRGSETRLVQVLRNLIGNAISFSPAGAKIYLRGRETGGLIELTVEDEGPGIPDGKLDSIFDRFYSERPQSEQFGSHSGLGLSISRQIVEAHQGRISAENRRDDEGQDHRRAFCHQAAESRGVEEMLTVIDHPLVQHKLTLMRKKDTTTGDFRRLAREISLLLGYEVLRDLPLEPITIETPMEEMQAVQVQGKKLCFISILRAGEGILDGILDLVPSARIGHVGLYRDPETHEPVEYYFKVPDDAGGAALRGGGPDAGHRTFRRRRDNQAERGRGEAHQAGVPDRGTRGRGGVRGRACRCAGLHRRAGPAVGRPRLYPPGPGRCRRPVVRDEVGLDPG